MPAKSERTLRFDRVFPGIGRIHRVSGTQNKRVFEKMDAMLITLYGQGRADIIKAIRDRKVEPLVVFDAFNRQRLDELPTADTIRPLGVTMREWRLGNVGSKWGALNHAAAERRVLKDMSASATLADLPPQLMRLRGKMQNTARTFNIMRFSVMAFMRDTVTKDSPLYAAVRAVPQLPVEEKMMHKPQMPMALRTAPLDAETMACALSMAASGMNPKEYWEDGFDCADGVITIHGKKRKARDRQVPDIGLTVQPPLTRSAFVQRIADSEVDFTPVDMRRSFANWCEDAGIPRTRRILYMGHASKGDVTFLYEKHEVAAFLKADREKLSKWYATQMVALVPHHATREDSSVAA